MNDTKNEATPTVSGDYAGPPKSHGFQNKTGEVPTDALIPEHRHNETPLPEKKPENVQLSEEEILEHKSQKTELLDLIAEGDRVKEEPKKEFKLEDFKLEIKGWIELKKKLREFAQRNQKTTRALDFIWMISKVLFYSVGLSFFVLSFFIYFAFEPLTRNYLDKKGLANISFESMQHSLSEITFNNVKDKNGLFTINRIKIQYSIADLIDKSIPLLEIDGLKLYIQEEPGALNNSQALMKILWNTGVFDRYSLFSIQSVRLENSILYVGNQEYKLPVNFSGVGSLGTKKQITFPLTLQNQYLTLKANLNVDISYSLTTWTMEIVSGALTLPGMDAQDLKGNLLAKTKSGELVSATFVGSLTKERTTKDVDIQVVPASQGRLSIKSTLTIPQKETAAVYSLNLSNITLGKDFKSFETASPIFFKVSNLEQGTFKADAIQISANGQLKCDLNGCSYQLLKRSDLIFFAPKYSFFDTQMTITYPLRLTLEPARDKNIIFKGGQIDFNLNFNKTGFDLRKQIGNEEPINTNIALDASTFKGTFDTNKEELNAGLITDIEKIDDSLLALTQGYMEAQITNEGINTYLKANNARLKQAPLFKPEVAVEMTITPDYYFVAKLNTENKQIALDINGYFHPYTGEILMALQTITPIVFEKNNLAPQDISGLFSSNIENVTGKVALKGQIHYKGARAISGPLHMLLDNVSFKYGNSEVSDLNTVLNITQLLPFGAQGGQNIFIRSVKNVLPFENINAQVFFDANRKQLNISSMDATLAGYQMRIDPMWYNYDAPIYSFVFKGKTVPIQNIIDATVLKDLQIKGNGSASLSTQLEGTEFSLKTLELSIPSEGYVAYTPKTYAHPFLETLKQLDFKKLSIYLTGQENGVELIFSSDNKSNKVKKKTNFRFTIKEALDKYVLPRTYPIPEIFLEEKERF